MENPADIRQRVSFGEFELDLRTRELFVGGGKLDLQEQPFLVLRMLLETPGELVSREELTRGLWPSDTFVDFENNLNRVIKRLREALNDSAETPRFIETLPRRGYRFVAPVRQVSRSSQLAPEEKPANPIRGRTALVSAVHLHRSSERAIAGDIPDVQSASPPQSSRHPWEQRAAFVVLALALGCLAGLLTFWLLSPATTLRVVRSQRLTTAARIDPWGPIISDGSRIFFLQREGDHWNVAQTSVTGGDWQIVPAPFHNTVVLDISPDHGSFLIASFTHREELMPLWIWPVQSGAPKRVGVTTAYGGVWYPNGRSILYSEDDGIYQADLDGTNAHKFVSTDGRASWFSWSPDGHFLRFTIYRAVQATGIWQVNSDGTHLHRLFSRWDNVPSECCGSWSPDGGYFFFASRHAGTPDIWALQEKTSLFHWRPQEPVRLTAGPVDFNSALSNPDGRKLFALSTTGRSEFARYDLVLRQLVPWLPGISAFSLAVSRDQAWVAYESASDWSLVRVNVDGSEPLVLTPPGLRVTGPSWSPDGKEIGFNALKANGIWGVFLVPMDGGVPKELFPHESSQGRPTWSPDGKFIAFDREDLNPKGRSYSIQVFDSSKNQLSLLPGSVGKVGPSWSPDGRFISAVTEDSRRLVLFDLDTKRWTELADATYVSDVRAWSRDGTTLYFQDLLGRNQPIYRIRMCERRTQLVTTFETLLRGGIQRAALAGLAPDGSLIIRLDRGGADIYSLDLESR